MPFTVSENTRRNIEDIHRNSLFIDPKFHHLDGESIQKLRENGVDTESESRQELQIVMEGEQHETKMETGANIEDLPELTHSEDTFVRIDALTGVIIDELQSNLEAK